MGKISPRRTRTVWADTTSNRPVIILPWMLKHGVDTLRFSDEFRGEEGSLTTTLAYRFAQVRTDMPGTWTVTANTRTADGEGTTDVDVSTTTDQMWVQPALMGKSAGSMAMALASLQCSTEEESRIVGARTIDVEATINSTQARFVAVGAPFPGLQLTSFMFAVQLFGVEGTTVLFQPCWRVFPARLDNPNAWATLDTEQSVTDDTAYNSGSEAVTIGTNQWAQVGMKLSGVGARGTMRVIVAAKF